MVLRSTPARLPMAGTTSEASRSRVSFMSGTNIRVAPKARAVSGQGCRWGRRR